MLHIERNVMKSVKIKTDELLAIVKENKEKHIADFIEAEADFKVIVLKIAKENLKTAMIGDIKKISNMKDFPHSPNTYETNYNRAIRMLELCVEDVIDIDDQTFNQLVLDEWTWKTSFSMSNAHYKSML
jgi:hypothetical protein